MRIPNQERTQMTDLELRVLNLMKSHPSDLHSETASLIFQVPVDEVTPEQRKYAKVYNYRLFYNTEELS